MKLTYTTKNGRITAEIEGESQKDLFGELNRFQEVFEETNCGKCGSDDIKYVVRTVDDNQWWFLLNQQIKIH